MTTRKTKPPGTRSHHKKPELESVPDEAPWEEPDPGIDEQGEAEEQEAALDDTAPALVTPYESAPEEMALAPKRAGSGCHFAQPDGSILGHRGDK